MVTWVSTTREMVSNAEDAHCRIPAVINNLARHNTIAGSEKNEKQNRCYLDKLKIYMHRKYYLFFHCACTRGHIVNALEWRPIRREWEWRLAMKRKRMNKMKCNERGLEPRSLVGLPRIEEHSTPLPHTPHPTPHLILSAWLSQHFPDMTPSHHLHHHRGNPGHLSQPQPPPDS